MQKIIFFDCVYSSVAKSLIGEWQNEGDTFQFHLKDKRIPTTGNSVDLILTINNIERGIVELKFTEEGFCNMHVNGEFLYKIKSMFYKDKNSYYIRLIDLNNHTISLQHIKTL